MSDPNLGEGVYRKLHGSEREAFRDHLLRLDVESRRLRFGHPVPDSFVRQYAEHTPWTGCVIHGFFSDDALRGTAELRPFGNLIPDKAEAAFSVEKPWQGKGIGKELLRRLVLSARNRGIKELTMYWLPENNRMRALAQQGNAQIAWDAGEVTGTVTPPSPTGLSFLREVFEDLSSVGGTVWDGQKRLLHLA